MYYERELYNFINYLKVLIFLEWDTSKKGKKFLFSLIMQKHKRSIAVITGTTNIWFCGVPRTSANAVVLPIASKVCHSSLLAPQNPNEYS